MNCAYFLCLIDEIAFTLDGEVTGVVTPPPGGFWEMGNFSGPSVWSDNKMSPFDQPVSFKFFVIYCSIVLYKFCI